MPRYVRKTTEEVQREWRERIDAELDAAPERYAHLLVDADGQMQVRRALEEISRRMRADVERASAEYLDELRSQAFEVHDGDQAEPEGGERE